MEAEGDVDKAVEILRVKGQKGVAKREGRTASNGAVVSLIAADNSDGVLVELNCETDFVAKGEKFVAVADAHRRARGRHQPADIEALLATEIEDGKTVQALRRRGERHPRREDRARPLRPVHRRLRRRPTCTAPARTCPRRSASWSSWTRTNAQRRQGRRAAHRRVRADATSPATRSPAETVENERRVAEATAREEGKPEAALPKIVEGRVNGFFKENVAPGAGVRQGHQEDRRSRCSTRPASRSSASRASGSASDTRTAGGPGRRVTDDPARVVRGRPHAGRPQM